MPNHNWTESMQSVIFIERCICLAKKMIKKCLRERYASHSTFGVKIRLSLIWFELLIVGNDDAIKHSFGIFKPTLHKNYIHIIFQSTIKHLLKSIIKDITTTICLDNLIVREIRLMVTKHFTIVEYWKKNNESSKNQLNCGQWYAWMPTIDNNWKPTIN